MVISNSVRFWLYLIPLIPSIIITIFALYYLRINQAFGTALKKHNNFLLLSCVLIGELFDVVWHVHYYRTDTALSSTPAFCLIWVFIGAATSVSIYFLIAWVSIGQHILIFYPNWLATKTKRFFCHYLPLAICVVYPTIFYAVIFFFVSCDVPFNYNKRLCDRYECVFSNHSIALWDSIIHYVMPVCITLSFSVTLLVRVVYHRYLIRQRIDWNRYKKIGIPLLAIYAFYMLLQFPPMILYTAYSAGLSRSVATDYYNDSLYFRHWIILFTPLVCAASLPGLRTKYRKILVFWRRKHTIQPIIIEMVPQHVNRPAAVVSIV
jgi:hypothetical protein